MLKKYCTVLNYFEPNSCIMILFFSDWLLLRDIVKLKQYLS